jgi:hypothetical protein
VPAAAASTPAAARSSGGSSAAASNGARGRALRDAVKDLAFSLGFRL